MSPPGDIDELSTPDNAPEADPTEDDGAGGDARPATRGCAAVSLERDYRRLLLAYPQDYRERRAEEILATLLDDAAPGQLRPTCGEVADLLIGGARQRLRLPRLPGVWVAAVLSALIVGAVVAAGAASVGWLSAGPLPDNRTVTSLVTSAFTPRPGTVTTRYERAFGYRASAGLTDRLTRVVLGDDTYTAGYVRVIGYPGEQHTLEDAAAVLIGSGWRVNPLREEPDGHVLTASKPGLTLEARLRFADNQLVVMIRRAPPSTVVPLAVLGWVTGALGGWLFAGVLARRAGQQDPNVRFLLQGAVIAGLMFAAPATALTTSALADALVDPASTAASPLWNAYMFPILRPFALAAAVFAVVAAGLATLATPEAQPAPATTAVEVKPSTLIGRTG